MKLDRWTTSAIEFADDPSAELIERARAILANRRRRSSCFGDELFGEFGWDMLLFLVIDAAAGRGVDIGELCEAVGSSQPTGVRWVAVLESRGLIEFVQYSAGAEEKLIRLSDEGQRQMMHYLSGLPSLGRA